MQLTEVKKVIENRQRYNASFSQYNMLVKLIMYCQKETECQENTCSYTHTCTYYMQQISECKLKIWSCKFLFFAWFKILPL